MQVPSNNCSREQLASYGVIQALLKRRAVSLTPAAEAELIRKHFRRRGSGPAQLYSHHSDWASRLEQSATPPYRTIRSRSTPGRSGSLVEPTIPASRTFHSSNTTPKIANHTDSAVLKPLSQNNQLPHPRHHVVAPPLPSERLSCHTTRHSIAGSSRQEDHLEVVASDRPRSVSFDVTQLFLNDKCGYSGKYWQL